MRRSPCLIVSALAVLAAFSAGDAAAQSATAGKLVFAQCAACHSVDASLGAAPSLQGVVGRKAGSFPGFRYSRAMRGAAWTWDPAKLDAFLADPQAALPGNAMPFSGLADAQDRADLIAYLGSLSGTVPKAP